MVGFVISAKVPCGLAECQSISEWRAEKKKKLHYLCIKKFEGYFLTLRKQNQVSAFFRSNNFVIRLDNCFLGNDCM